MTFFRNDSGVLHPIGGKGGIAHAMKPREKEWQIWCPVKGCKWWFGFPRFVGSFDTAVKVLDVHYALSHRKWDESRKIMPDAWIRLHDGPPGESGLDNVVYGPVQVLWKTPTVGRGRGEIRGELDWVTTLGGRTIMYETVWESPDPKSVKTPTDIFYVGKSLAPGDRIDPSIQIAMCW